MPITVLATDETKIEIGDPGAEPVWKPVVVKQDWERWNDWGIGLLLQGERGALLRAVLHQEADLLAGRRLGDRARRERRCPWCGVVPDHGGRVPSDDAVRAAVAAARVRRRRVGRSINAGPR